MLRLKRILKKMFIYTFATVAFICCAFFLIVNQSQFGRAPKGKRLERIQRSSHYKDGKFHNLVSYPLFPKGHTMAGEVYSTFFGKNPRKFPTDTIPSKKTDLRQIPIDQDVLVWFGHSSYYIQLEGKRILVDPVLKGSASPLPFGVKAFKGTDRYQAEDFPEIDYVLISHDHFDHLDYRTIMALKSKIKYVVCGLGVGENFEQWGFNPKQIIEGDWDETVVGNDNFKIHTETAIHGSGRKFQTDNTLWLSYIIEGSNQKIYVGGDSGYGPHFADIGKKYGPIDLAILDNGQYSYDWYSSIHMSPKFALQAAKDLNAKRLFPVHSSKFVLSKHPWDEPLVKISQLSAAAGVRLVHPMIGEKVHLQDSTQVFKQWWKGIK
jgi:L-ascorbate metabolism protein UlaG (beta-lactamase superfamily)